jgi:hypothetical protein
MTGDGVTVTDAPRPGFYCRPCVRAGRPEGPPPMGALDWVAIYVLSGALSFGIAFNVKYYTFLPQ